MNVIHASGLTKVYQRPVKEQGFRGSLKSLFKRSVHGKEGAVRL